MSAVKKTKKQHLNTKELIRLLPEKMRVGPHIVLIKIVTKKFSEDVGMFGMFLPMEAAIFMAPAERHATPSILADTLLHEINHAVFWAYNIDTKRGEEHIVSNLSTGWTQVFLDNPWVATWVAAALN